MNRATLIRRLELLEGQLVPPRSFASRVLSTATDGQLEDVEMEIEHGGPFPVWDALVASYRSEVSGS